jgi:A/G-specific adenine glycosylase
MTSFTQCLLKWHNSHGRKELPWQKNKTPYRVWVSEIMLQQTQVTTVIDYYLRFMQRFPSIDALASAPQDDVLALWAGLGYYTRARNLHKAANIIKNDFNSKFPTDIEEVIKLPGIGRSTAGAILAISLGQCHPILDGNVKRVLTRFYAIDGFPGKVDIEKKLWKVATEHTPTKNVATYTQAIMDLGATLCSRSKPTCTACPINKDCQAFLTQQIEKFPNKKPKKTTPTKTTHFIILLNKDNQIFLYKRPDTGIWGGLWSLPEMDKPDEAALHYQNQLGIKIADQFTLPQIKHVFSHYKLLATPHVIRLKNNPSHAMLDDTQLWCDINKPIPKGVAAPIKKLLNTITQLTRDHHD